MKKSVFVCSVFLVLFLSGYFVSAATSEPDMGRAYACLRSRINQSADITFQAAAFSVLALAPADPRALDKLETTKNNISDSTLCWPRGGCTLKDTALGILAYRRLEKNTQAAVNWLGTQTGIPTELAWYLQITTQNNQADTCTVSYDGADYSISVKDTMKLEGNGGTCLRISGTGYSLQITPACVQKDFLISCSQPFKTNLLYTKQSDRQQTTYVSAETHEGDGGGFTTEKPGVKCFAVNGVCDYEGTLWATLAFDTAGNSTTEYIPYLRAVASDNQQFLPHAFLYLLLRGTGVENEHLTKLMGADSRSSGSPPGMWKATNTNNEYYDTALALVALGGRNSGVSGLQTSGVALAQKQAPSGCWSNDNILYTSMIIWGWLPQGSGTNTGSCTIDGVCSADNGENRDTCAADCYCGNNRCEAYENITTCAADCTATCGNNICETPHENQTSCPGDCSGVSLPLPEQMCSQNNGVCRSNCSSSESLTNYYCSEGGMGCCVSDVGSGSTGDECRASGYSCGSRSACSNAGGFILEDHVCLNTVEACCSESLDETQQSCDQLLGVVCSAGTVCEFDVIQSADTASCCLGQCRTANTDDQCISAGGSCRSTCESGESSSSESCSDTNDVCCIASSGNGGSTSDTSSGSLLWLWILLLIILIGLVVLAIIYKDKLRLWLFKNQKGKGAASTRPGTTPPGGPGLGVRVMPPRVLAGQRPLPQRGMPLRTPPRQPVGRRPLAGEKQKERDETLEKLRKMSE